MYWPINIRTIAKHITKKIYLSRVPLMVLSRDWWTYLMEFVGISSLTQNYAGPLIDVSLVYSIRYGLITLGVISLLSLKYEHARNVLYDSWELTMAMLLMRKCVYSRLCTTIWWKATSWVYFTFILTNILCFCSFLRVLLHYRQMFHKITIMKGGNRCLWAGDTYSPFSTDVASSCINLCFHGVCEDS